MWVVRDHHGHPFRPRTQLVKRSACRADIGEFDPRLGRQGKYMSIEDELFLLNIQRYISGGTFWWILNDHPHLWHHLLTFCYNITKEEANDKICLLNAHNDGKQYFFKYSIPENKFQIIRIEP